MDIERVLVTGATGYVGGRLVPALLDAGYAVRCASRRPHPLTDRPFAERVTTAIADVLTGEGLEQALEGIDAAYYLVHSLGSGADLRGQDRRAADNFRRAAAAAGLERIVYLGGLGEATDGPLSEHLASRQEVLDHPEAADRILEIGGPDVLTYEQAMRRYAQLTGLLPDHTPVSFDAAVRAATASGDGDPPLEAKRSFDPPWAG